ncbi:MAG: 4'-phosphopantetheinyl transferase superfamily protein [Lachnospiraceae bacterium]|nr:4'-phosphopantetheinyl transferase superfamily protein [Lachnospiraceae bacterium]
MRQQSVATFFLLIRALSDIGLCIEDQAVWDELKYSFEERGKPYFKGCDGIHFSLSHTSGAALCAIAGTRTGCDIERIRHRNGIIRVAQRVFNERELEECHIFPDDPSMSFREDMVDHEKFFTIWTRKEAYVKYLGTGISDIMSGDTVDEDVCICSDKIRGCVYSICTGRESRKDLISDTKAIIV